MSVGDDKFGTTSVDSMVREVDNRAMDSYCEYGGDIEVQ